jgi:phage tail protein X
MDDNFDSEWPIVGGGPDPVPITEVTPAMDATWIALGKPQPERFYISMQGDWWDTIAMRVYGRQRGNEHLMFRLIEDNYDLREISQFPAGIKVCVPEVAIATDIPLVPWKNASRTTAR